MIPKIIHLCWLSGDKYPEKIKRCIDSWHKILPDYEIMIWDTQSFDLNSSVWVKEAFENKKYAFAADYIRFYSVYTHGGIYLDSDVEVLKSFNDLLELPYFIGAEKAGTIEAAIIGANKGEEWLKTCMDYYNNKHFVKEDGTMDLHKLPEIMVEQLSKYKTLRFLSIYETKNLANEYCIDNIVILPSEYFSPKVFDSREVLLTDKTYAIHHYQNSWFSHKAKIYYRTRSIAIRLFGYKAIREIEKLLIPSKR